MSAFDYIEPNIFEDNHNETIVESETPVTRVPVDSITDRGEYGHAIKGVIIFDGCYQYISDEDAKRNLDIPWDSLTPGRCYSIHNPSGGEDILLIYLD